MIEKGIPIPPKKYHGGPKRGPGHAMEIGDSILFATRKEANNVAVALGRAGKKGSQRKVDGGWRVWRIA